MRKYSYLLGALCALILFALALDISIQNQSTQSLSTNTSTATFSNTRHGYSLEYKNDYRVREYPDDYPRLDIRDAESIQISKSGSPVAFWILRAQHFVREKDMDTMTLSDSARALFEAQAACDSLNPYTNNDLKELGKVNIAGKDAYAFDLKDSFGQEISETYCGGFALSGQHTAYVIENGRGTKLIVLAGSNDSSAREILRSLRFE